MLIELWDPILKKNLLKSILADLVNSTRDSLQKILITFLFMQMIFKLTAKLLIGYDAEKSGDNIDDFFSNFTEGFMKLPINIPGTAYHKCLQV